MSPAAPDRRPSLPRRRAPHPNTPPCKGGRAKEESLDPAAGSRDLLRWRRAKVKRPLVKPLTLRTSHFSAPGDAASAEAETAPRQGRAGDASPPLVARLLGMREAGRHARRSNPARPWPWTEPGGGGARGAGLRERPFGVRDGNGGGTSTSHGEWASCRTRRLSAGRDGDSLLRKEWWWWVSQGVINGFLVNVNVWC